MNLIHSLFEPPGDGPHPAIIALHGRGASALDLLGLAPDVAGGKFMLICPQGQVTLPLGPSVGYAWFPFQPSTPPAEQQVESAVLAAEQFIDSAIARYPVNQRKLVLLGFSQGGMMAYRLALRHPEKFAALIGISTYMPPELKEKAADHKGLKQLLTLVQHGRNDDTIEIARARQTVETLRELGVPLTFREYACGHEITVESLRDLSEFLTGKVLSPILAA